MKAIFFNKQKFVPITENSANNSSVDFNGQQYWLNLNGKMLRAVSQPIQTYIYSTGSGDNNGEWSIFQAQSISSPTKAEITTVCPINNSLCFSIQNGQTNVFYDWANYTQNGGVFRLIKPLTLERQAA